jgi:hypothetical protein
MGNRKAIRVKVLSPTPASGGRSRTASARWRVHWVHKNHKHSFVAHIQVPVNPTPFIYHTQKLELPFWGKPGRHRAAPSPEQDLLQLFDCNRRGYFDSTHSNKYVMVMGCVSERA